MLMLSGIQHFRFCPRQWALIHIEQQWAENRRTAEGQILHKHADDPFYRQKCGQIVALRAVNIASYELGLYGITDIVELHPSEKGPDTIFHPNYPGYWKPYPVEYKHGKPKGNEVDEVQLVAQAMCLEEQYNIHIAYGAFYYAEIRQRIEVEITSQKREIVKECAKQMHSCFQTGQIPPIKYGHYCENCSLKDICLPQMANCARASYYLNKYLYEETA